MANIIVQNLVDTFHILSDRVRIALRTQIGDRRRLLQVRSDVLEYAAAADMHRHLFTPQDLRQLEQSLTNMVQELDSASTRSAEPPDHPPPAVATVIHTGRPGRPRIHIDPTFLAFALDIRGPTGLANDVIPCSSRSIRRRALDHGLVEPGVPVHQRIHDPQQPDAPPTDVWISSTSQVSTLTDNELDQLVAEALELFPTFGNRLLKGYLASYGHRVPATRISQSYLRFVIHCFIDGYSRYVVGIQVNDNNKAATVLDLFLGAMNAHGVPSRVLSILISWVLFSSMYCRSVHNTRIERLWYDVTKNFGKKWKNFFKDLEVYEGLHAEN
ncbi:hypothetical protein SISSUDRAFT_1027978, partial [Sistotremastrum suecicum HHB10207 ss-3]